MLNLAASQDMTLITELLLKVTSLQLCRNWGGGERGLDVSDVFSVIK